MSFTHTILILILIVRLILIKYGIMRKGPISINTHTKVAKTLIILNRAIHTLILHSTKISKWHIIDTGNTRQRITLNQNVLTLLIKVINIQRNITTKKLGLYTNI